VVIAAAIVAVAVVTVAASVGAVAAAVVTANVARRAIGIDPGTRRRYARRIRGEVVMSNRAVRAPRNVEKRKKKAGHAIPRKKESGIRGNTIGARTKAKKLAGQRRVAMAKAAATST